MAITPNPADRRPPAPPVAIHGIPFDNLTAAESVEFISRLVSARTPNYAVCADTHLLISSGEDAGLHRILSEARLVLCASRSLLWASRLLGNALPEMIGIRELLELIFDAAVRHGHRLGLLGENEAAISPAIQAIKSRYPKLDITGVSARGSAASGNGTVMQSLRELRPDVLLVALGFHDDLKWIAAHHRELGVPVCLAIGDALGTSSSGRHSPPLLRKVRDYAVFAGSFLPQVWRLRLRSRRPKNREVSQPVQSEPDWRWIKLPERLDLQAINDDVLLLDQLLADGRHCLLEMSAVQFIDSTGIGRLLRLHKRIRATGKQLVLLAPSETTQRTLKLVHLHEFFAIARDEAAVRALIEARTQEEAATVAAPAESRTGSLI